MSTSYLVNIVANDFRDGQSIFQPFVLDQKMHNGTNGHESSETPCVFPYHPFQGFS
jgi:hypothetical protein